MSDYCKFKETVIFNNPKKMIKLYNNYMKNPKLSTGYYNIIISTLLIYNRLYYYFIMKYYIRDSECILYYLCKYSDGFKTDNYINILIKNGGILIYYNKYGYFDFINCSILIKLQLIDYFGISGLRNNQYPVYDSLNYIGTYSLLNKIIQVYGKY